jgi:hypothetical protein
MNVLEDGALTQPLATAIMAIAVARRLATAMHRRRPNDRHVRMTIVISR